MCLYQKRPACQLLCLLHASRAMEVRAKLTLEFRVPLTTQSEPNKEFFHLEPGMGKGKRQSVKFVARVLLSPRDDVSLSKEACDDGKARSCEPDLSLPPFVRIATVLDRTIHPCKRRIWFWFGAPASLWAAAAAEGGTDKNSPTTKKQISLTAPTTRRHPHPPPSFGHLKSNKRQVTTDLRTMGSFNNVTHTFCWPLVRLKNFTW